MSGSRADPSQFAPPVAEGNPRVPRVPSAASWSEGGEYTLGLNLNPSIASSARALISGVQSMRSSSVKPCLSNGAGLDGIG